MPDETRAGKIVFGLIVGGGCLMALAFVVAGVSPELTLLPTLMRFAGAGLTVTGFLLWLRHPHLLSRWEDEDEPTPDQPDQSGPVDPTDQSMKT